MTQITYNDVEALKKILVGKRIVGSRKGTRSDAYDPDLDFIEFILDDGTVLEARATDGGCSCSNGCWSVENSVLPDAESIITNVECAEDADEWGYSATLRLSVYADDVKTELVKSEGGDNGYYGWGYALFVKTPGEVE